MLQNVAKDVGGIEVDRVIVSDATRSMSRGQKLETLPEMEDEIDSIKNELMEINQQDSKYQLRLAELNTCVMGRKIDQGKYQTICHEQDKLKKKIAANVMRRLQLKQSLAQADSYRRDFRVEEKQGLNRRDQLLEKILLELQRLNRNVTGLVESKGSNKGA